MPDLACRLAKLEERSEIHDNFFIERRRESDHVLEKLEKISSDITRMKGFTAGIAMAFSMIGGIIAFSWDRLVGH